VKQTTGGEVPPSSLGIRNERRACRGFSQRAVRSESGSEAIQIGGLTFIPRRRFDKPDTPIMATVIETTYGV